MPFAPLQLSLPIILAAFLALGAETSRRATQALLFRVHSAAIPETNEIAIRFAERSQRLSSLRAKLPFSAATWTKPKLSFRAVIAADPRAGTAYANLGVIAMRRKQWDHALTLLQKAAAPRAQDVRHPLNIGLVQFRRADYAAAIAPLSAVLRDQPDSRAGPLSLGAVPGFHRTLRRRRCHS